MVYLIQSGWLAEVTFTNLKSRQQQLREWTDTHRALALASYFFLYVVSVALSLPGASVLTLAGGAVFGLVEGVVIVSFASTLGATLCLLGTRFVLRDWVERRFQAIHLRVQEGLEREGALYLFTLRLIPAVPFFAINLVFGLTRFSAIKFFWISQLGMLPGTIAYVNAGTQLGQIESPQDILSWPVILSFGLLAALPWLSRLLFHAWRKGRG